MTADQIAFSTSKLTLLASSVMGKDRMKEKTLMLDTDTRVHYAGSLGEYDGTVMKVDGPAVTANLDGIGLVLVAEDELQPLSDQYQVPQAPSARA